jgi:glycerol uptake facilitator-like aquaporin
VFRWREVPAYIGAQVGGAATGVVLAHLMFGEAVLSISRHSRAGAAQAFAECLATVGLLLVIRGAAALGALPVALAVGAYICAAYWFTSSTSFANPAVTLARTMTQTFAGIRPADAPGFLAGQLAGVAAAHLLGRLVFPADRQVPEAR